MNFAMRILNVENLNTGGLDDILGFCHQRSHENKGAFLIPMNPIKVIKARKLPDFQRIIDKADWVFPDAWGMKWAASFLYSQKIPLTPGHKLMISLLKQAEAYNHSIYLLGTTEKILEIAVAELKKQYPRLRISGYHHGFFSEPEEADVCRKIVELRPHYIFVGMGECKQERIIGKIKKIYPGAIYLGVGGTIDLIANIQPTPSDWIRQHHLEWVFRLFRQPFRLPRFKALPIFAYLIFLEKIKFVISS
jgi:N-acetylglucosaminyldiphosphoundecaprenol N-acetyl-beta-D-mannosaminyltransferase